jgi:hypothetical protein
MIEKDGKNRPPPPLPPSPFLPPNTKLKHNHYYNKTCKYLYRDISLALMGVLTPGSAHT